MEAYQARVHRLVDAVPSGEIDQQELAELCMLLQGTDEKGVEVVLRALKTRLREVVSNPDHCSFALAVLHTTFNRGGRHVQAALLSTKWIDRLVELHHVAPEPALRAQLLQVLVDWHAVHEGDTTVEYLRATLQHLNEVGFELPQPNRTELENGVEAGPSLRDIIGPASGASTRLTRSRFPRDAGLPALYIAYEDTTFGEMDEDIHNIALASVSYKGRIWNPIFAALSEDGSAESFQANIKRHRTQTKRFPWPGQETRATLKVWNRRLKAALLGNTSAPCQEPLVKTVEASQNEKKKSHKERLIAFYKFYQPEKVNQVVQIAKKYEGKEKQMWLVLTKRYGPEP